MGSGHSDPVSCPLKPEAQAGSSAGKPLRRPCGAGRKSCCSLLGILTGVRTLEPCLLRPPGWVRKGTAGPRAQQCSRQAPRWQSCGLDRLPAAPVPWAQRAGSCFCGEGRERAQNWAAALGTVLPPIPRLPGHREDPLQKAPCTLYLWAQCAAPPLHQIPCSPPPTPRGTAPFAPPGPRCPGSRRGVALARTLPLGNLPATDDPQALCRSLV